MGRKKTGGEKETQRGIEIHRVGQRLKKTQTHTNNTHHTHTYTHTRGEGQAETWRISKFLMISPVPLFSAPWISFRGEDVGALLPTPGLSKDGES